MFKENAMTYSIPFVIIVTNILIAEAIILLIQLVVREETASKEDKSISNTIFLAQFFNTGIAILLVNAKLPNNFFQVAGAYYDYTPEWYANVGRIIVDTMLIYAFWPYLTLLFTTAKPWIR